MSWNDLRVVGISESNNTLLILGNYPESYGLELWLELELFANTKSFFEINYQNSKKWMIQQGEFFSREHSDRFLKLAFCLFVFILVWIVISHFSNTYILNIIIYYIVSILLNEETWICISKLWSAFRAADWEEPVLLQTWNVIAE